jgi:hypothetical protein
MSVKIFLSAVSSEFGPYRDELRADLTRQNVEVKVQEDFKDLGGLTLDKLDAYIVQCDGVIHLVGEMTGAMPFKVDRSALTAKYHDLAATLPTLYERLQNPDGVSYTQWEAWLALYHGKLLFIALADKTAPRAGEFAPTQASRDAQARHLSCLQRAGRFPGCTFTGVDNLAKSIVATAILDLLARADNQSLYELYNQNAERIVSTFDQVLGVLGGSSRVKPDEAKSAAERLQALHAEFITLHMKHMDAVIARKHMLAHDLTEQIHMLQDEALEIIRTRIGDIGRRWYASLGREYIDAPTPEQDPRYHAVAIDIARLHEETEQAMASWRYPPATETARPAH